jgi:hypothetical protein
MQKNSEEKDMKVGRKEKGREEKLVTERERKDLENEGKEEEEYDRGK